MELNDIIDLIFDFVDNIMPGIISLFSGAVVTTKNKVKKFTQIYKKYSKLIQFLYLIFVILHLSFIFFIQNKRVIESSIYIKIAAVLFNLLIFTYTTMKSLI